MRKFSGSCQPRKRPADQNQRAVRSSELSRADRKADQSSRRSHLLSQPFGLQRLMHFRAPADARHIGAEVRIGFEIYSNEIRPINDRKCVRIGDRELAAHEVLPASELIVEPGEPLVDAGLRRILDVVRRSLVEQRREALVQFGADEGEPLLVRLIYEAKRLCPGLTCVLARHERHVEIHHRLHTSEAGLRLAPCSTSDRRLEYLLTRRED